MAELRRAACRATRGGASTTAAIVAQHQGRYRAGVRRHPLVWKGLFRHFDQSTPGRFLRGPGSDPLAKWIGLIANRACLKRPGNPRLRTTLIQLAWLWLRNQPQSALALWFKERVNRNGGRLKKTTIVALARKLLVALWKYVTAGVVIEGA